MGIMRICSSCGKQMGEADWEPPYDGAVTHGLCDECLHHFMAQTGVSLNEYIENYKYPVVTVAPDGSIGTANTLAQEILGKDVATMQGQQGGDVFECRNALLPGGCGHTIHCSGCAIRRTVMDTIETGRPHLMVPAALQRESSGGDITVQLLISTEKAGGVVFLTVDELSPDSDKTPEKESS